LQDRLFEDQGTGALGHGGRTNIESALVVVIFLPLIILIIFDLFPDSTGIHPSRCIGLHSNTIL